MRRVTSLGACTLLALLTACASPRAVPPASGAHPAAAPDRGADWLAWAATGNAAAGAIVFEVCEGCHRGAGTGRANGSYPRLAGQHATVLVKQLDDIRSGRRQNHRMQPFAAEEVIGRQQVADVAAFLQAQTVTPDNGKGPGTDLARGESLYRQDCARCHGAGGEGRADAFVPRLSGQHYLYLLREARAIRDGQRGNSNPDMVEAIRAYDEAGLAAVSDYASRLPLR